MTVWIGTSGYSYADWVGPVYPQGTDSSRFLEEYARIFSAVELNFSYYRQPDPGLLSAMIGRSPERFLFAIKAHKSLTHVVAPDWEREAANFIRNIQPLVDSDRLLAVLLQFPFSFHYSRQNRIYLSRLCEALSGLPIAVELRNGEWHTDRVIEGLRERDAVYTITDYPALNGLPTVHMATTTKAAYIRFHGRNAENWWTGDNASRYDYLYSEPEIDEWVERIRKITSQTQSLAVMFNNHWRGQAVQNALLLKKKLEALPGLELPGPTPDRAI